MAGFKSTKIPLFRRCVMQNFPFIEEDFDALTDYGLLCKIVEYLNNVISSTNASAAQVESLTNSFNTLKNYVDNYFANLDVQTEINNKLEDMAKSGALSEIISTYVDAYVVPQIEAQNDRISNVEDLVHGLGNFAPIPVSSTSQMSDHSKVYVLTGTGQWYYWNSSNSTWTVGGTYQATSLGLGSVDFDNLTNNVAKNLYGFSSDVSTLGIIQQGVNANNWNITTPMLLKAGTTIEVSSEFVSNYKWMLRRVNPDTELDLTTPTSAIFDYITDTSYTLLQDEYCVFCWLPQDNNWNTTDYTVDRRHRLTSSDITSILYFYPKRVISNLIDLDYNQILNSLFGCTKESNIRFALSGTRIATSVLWKSKYDTIVNIKDSANYDYGIVIWNVEGNSWTQVSDSGWISEQRIIPANSYFTLAFRKKDNSNILSIPNIKSMLEIFSYADLKYIRDYVDSYEQGISTYNYEGENLNFQIKHGYEASDLFNTTLLTTSSQGFDIYGGYLVQLYNGGHLNILDMTDGTEVSSISNIGFQHGDTMQFSNVFYDPNDQFPLAYVTSDTTPGKMYVVRIQSFTTASIIKTYEFPAEDGYYCGYIVDNDNNIVYSLGYKINSFRNSENNATIVSVYDMNKETQIAGDRYSLELIERYEKQFIYCMQGMKFLNGLIYIVSSYVNSEQHTRIYVYDPIRGLFPAIFTGLPDHIEMNETEDLAFIKGTSNYEMVVGTRTKYMKFTFK